MELETEKSKKWDLSLDWTRKWSFSDNEYGWTFPLLFSMAYLVLARSWIIRVPGRLHIQLSSFI